MDEFRSFYRCTLCGEGFFEQIWTTGRDAARKALPSNLGYPFTQITPNPKLVHECFEGSFGVAELLGMKIKKGENDG